MFLQGHAIAGKKGEAGARRRRATAFTIHVITSQAFIDHSFEFAELDRVVGSRVELIKQFHHLVARQLHPHRRQGFTES